MTNENDYQTTECLQQNISFYFNNSFCREIRDKLKKDVSEIRNKIPTLVPGLAIVQVGGREDSNVYIRMKIKAAEEIGIYAEHVQLPKSTTQDELLTVVSALDQAGGR